MEALQDWSKVANLCSSTSFNFSYKSRLSCSIILNIKTPTNSSGSRIINLLHLGSTLRSNDLGRTMAHDNRRSQIKLPGLELKFNMQWSPRWEVRIPAMNGSFFTFIVSKVLLNLMDHSKPLFRLFLLLV